MQDSSRGAVVVGGGFAGLAAAYELAIRGRRVTLLEKEDELGGLAGGFAVDGSRVEKFYHHWFVHDAELMELIRELGVEDQMVLRATRTGIFCEGRIWRLSTPLDLLTFAPLRLRDRIRLGLSILRARRVKDWKPLDDVTAEEWLPPLCGRAAYDRVWAPLLRGKFGDDAPNVSAAWFWSKLLTRGGTRGKRGQEVLAYFRGGLDALVACVVRKIQAMGGLVLTGREVNELVFEQGRFRAAVTSRGRYEGDAVVLTPALPVICKLCAPHAPDDYLRALRRIRYVANICLVLELDRSLSDTYWLNVNDPGFPFVGIIEHTNFVSPADYGGRHIVYLSRYVPEESTPWRHDDATVFNTALPHLRRVFPDFAETWVQRYHVWRTPHGQAAVLKGYAKLVPEMAMPMRGAYLATLAQVYPEDRGMTYAIRDGRKAASLADQFLTSGQQNAASNLG